MRLCSCYVSVCVFEFVYLFVYLSLSVFICVCARLCVLAYACDNCLEMKAIKMRLKPKFYGRPHKTEMNSEL